MTSSSDMTTMSQVTITFNVKRNTRKLCRKLTIINNNTTMTGDQRLKWL